MKINVKKLEIVFIALLYLSALYLWTLPIQNNRLPFGDVDASSHFTIGDYMTTYDRSILKIPYPITFRYAGQNSMFPSYLWYPPQYWTNLGAAQAFGGERIIPPFIFVAIFSSLIILSSYFFIRELFGFYPAFLSSFLLIFSARDFMIYLWGQWPQSLSFAFTPMVIYCFYKYQKSKTQDGKYPISYACIMALLLSGQFFFHPQGLIASGGALIITAIFLGIHGKKIPFDFRHVFVALAIFIFVCAALAPFNIGYFLAQLTSKQGPVEGKIYHFDKLFKWYHGIKGDLGLPDFYFTYNLTHGTFEGGLLSWWTLPFLIIGIIVLLVRRQDRDMMLLGWLASYYLLTRMIVFGYGTRDIRMFAYEAHVFYPIIAIGLLSLSSAIKHGNFRTYAKYGLIAFFLIMAVSINGKSAYSTLNKQQNSIGRLNTWQYEAALWARNNLADKVNIYDVGTLGYNYYGAKIKWMGVIAQRHFIMDSANLNLTDHIMVDYTDALLLKDQNYLNSIQNFDKTLQNYSIVYNKNNIKVYEIAKTR